MTTHDPGKLVIQRTAPRPEIPWKVLIWQGDGEHWIDGAEFETYNQAREAVIEALEGKEY